MVVNTIQFYLIKSILYKKPEQVSCYVRWAKINGLKVRRREAAGGERVGRGMSIKFKFKISLLFWIWLADAAAHLLRPETGR